MMNQLRIVSPPGWVYALAGLIYVSFQAFARFLEWVEKLPFFSQPDKMTGNYLIFLAMCYASYRVVAFHPALQPGYYDWLCGTPWTSRKPLPLGPIHLVWQDAVILGLTLAVFSPILRWHVVYVLQAFLIAYLLALAVSCYFTGQKLWPYVLALGLGWMMLFWPDPQVFIPLAAMNYALAWLVLRQSLAGFPWEGSNMMESVHRQVRVSFYAQKHLQKKLLGWPHDQLGPDFADLNSRGVDLGLTNWRDTLLSGLLAGWWFFVMMTELRQADPKMRGSEIYMFFFALGLGTFFRLLIYLNGYLPPLTLMGRIVHLRLIIPGYDKVFVSSILAVMVGVAVWYAPMWTSVDPLILVSTGIAVTWWILFGMGPGLKAWRLTGNHRISSGIRSPEMVRTS